MAPPQAKAEKPANITRLCYSEGVHKSIYASGFLYHSPSQQILLQQLTRDADTMYELFGGSCDTDTDPVTVFQKSVEKALGKKVTASSIHAVYDYIHEGHGEHFIFYAEVSDPDAGAGWFSLSRLSKHVMSEQTRHDIVVGERVIRSLIPQT